MVLIVSVSTIVIRVLTDRPLSVTKSVSTIITIMLDLIYCL